MANTGQMLMITFTVAQNTFDIEFGTLYAMWSVRLVLQRLLTKLTITCAVA